MDMTTSPIVSRAEFENWSDEDIVERVLPVHLVIIARSGKQCIPYNEENLKGGLRKRQISFPWQVLRLGRPGSPPRICVSSSTLQSIVAAAFSRLPF